MSEHSHRDTADLAPAAPPLALTQWRETRDSDRFKQRCLDEHGPVVVGGHEFHPAAVLALKEGALDRAREEWKTWQREDDEATVCDQFPAPIAIPFQQFLEGPREPGRRLTRLRDTWEGLINVLAGLAVAEATAIGIGTPPVQVIDSTSRRAVKHKDLRSDRIAIRIGLLEGLLESWNKAGVKSELARLIPVGIPSELRRLNSVRNGFSHLGTLSDHQARKLIDESSPILHEVLVDLLFLADVQFLRLVKIVPGAPPSAEVDFLNGHSTARRIRDLPLDPAWQQVVLHCVKVGDYDRVLARLGDRCLDMSPYFYACDDDSGHHTRVLAFKKRHATACELEVVGEATVLTSDAPLHAPDFDRCERAILGAVGEDIDE